jgi:uncharacterized protein YjiK
LTIQRGDPTEKIWTAMVFPHRCLTVLSLGLFLASCAGDSEGARPAVSLGLAASFPLQFQEPSGLALDAGGEALWVVGNDPSRVYRISLEGRTLAKLTYEGKDLEGIVLDPADSSLWVVEERAIEVVHLDRTGNELARTRLGLSGSTNSGLEGICLSPAGTVLVLKEKDPGLLIELTASLAVAVQYPLAFAEDYSDLTWDPSGSWLWVLSDQDRTLFRCSPSGEPLAAYGISAAKPEGVAVDAARGLVYVVSDSRNRLYVYTLPDSVYSVR